MSGIGTRIKKRRLEKGLSLKALAEAAGGLRYQTIQDLEKGKSSGTKHLLAIARVLEVSPEYLEGDSSNPNDGGKRFQTTRTGMLKDASKGEHHSLGFSRGAKAEGADLAPLPVLGMAETGPNGWSLWNGDVIDTIPRPANLAGARDAYAVYIAGNSMEPRFFEGEAVHIHPAKPVTIGSFVLVQLKPASEGESPRAVVKRLVKRSASKVVLEQYNPPKTFEIKASEVVSMHRVVGLSEA